MRLSPKGEEQKNRNKNEKFQEQLQLRVAIDSKLYDFFPVTEKVGTDNQSLDSIANFSCLYKSAECAQQGSFLVV